MSKKSTLLLLSPRQKLRSHPASLIACKAATHKRFRSIVSVLFLVGTLSLTSFDQAHAFTEADFKAAPVADATAITQTRSGARWPVSGNISQGFYGYHPGIDIESPVGTPIHPFYAGIVADAGFQAGGYGNYVLINHKNGYFSLYAHLDAIMTSRGNEVNQDGVIGTIGLTGRTSGPHLHFEIHENGRAVDPRGTLPGAQPAPQAPIANAEGGGEQKPRPNTYTYPVSTAPIIEPKVEEKKPETESLYIKISEPQTSQSGLLR